MKPKLAITCGDPAGVGPEIIAAWLAAHPDEARDTAVIGPARWLASQCQGRLPELRCSRSMLIMDGVRAGAGLGILPCMAGDEDPALQRLTPPIGDLSGQPLYLVVHRELRGVPRIRAASSAIVALLKRHRARLDGAGD